MSWNETFSNEACNEFFTLHKLYPKAIKCGSNRLNFGNKDVWNCKVEFIKAKLYSYHYRW